MRPSGVLSRFIVRTDYQVSDEHTTQKHAPVRFASAFVPQIVQAAQSRCSRWPGGAASDAVYQTLLPLHLSFCRTTLKNEASGNEASGSVFFALRIVTVDPRSTWIGLRPSSVRKTG